MTKGGASYVYSFHFKGKAGQSPLGFGPVSFTHSNGYISFCRQEMTIAQIKETWGGQLAERIPLTGRVREILAGEGRQLSWIESLFVGALHFAKESVTYVAPDTWILPQAVARAARKRNKNLQRVSLSRFTIEEIRKLRTIYKIPVSNIDLPDDTNDPQFLQEMAAKHGDLMKSYWE